MRTVDLVGRQCAQESLMIALPFRTKISRAAVTAACVHDGVRLRASPRPVRSAGSFAATELHRRGKATTTESAEDGGGHAQVTWEFGTPLPV